MVGRERLRPTRHSLATALAVAVQRGANIRAHSDTRLENGSRTVADGREGMSGFAKTFFMEAFSGWLIELTTTAT